MPRPELPQNERQSELISVKMRPRDLRGVKRAARAAGLPLATWARTKLLEAARLS